MKKHMNKIKGSHKSVKRGLFLMFKTKESKTNMEKSLYHFSSISQVS